MIKIKPNTPINIKMDFPQGFKTTEELKKAIERNCAEYEIEEVESEDERIRKMCITAVNIAASADGGFLRSEASECLAWLEEQKDKNCLACDQHLKGYIAGRKVAEEEKQKDITPIVVSNADWDCQRAYSEGYQKGMAESNKQKPAEWSDEDETFLKDAIGAVEDYYSKGCGQEELVTWLKSLRPQPKEEREPMEIKYGGKIYQVHGVRAIPGGATGYIIEDEPGHYDCIFHPDEVLGGGYGIKGCGSSYPTKEANFGQPHWKPSEEQMAYFSKAILYCIPEGDAKTVSVMKELHNDLKKL